MEFHLIDPTTDRERLRGFLATSDPDDYLLEELDQWIRSGRHWIGKVGGEWVAFGRTHDLGHGDGWISGVRVRSPERGRGLGGQLLDGLLSNGRSAGLTSFRAVIEDGNVASRRLFERHDFLSVRALTLRCGSAAPSGRVLLRRARPQDRLVAPVGWLADAGGLADLLPGSDGGRFGRWDPSHLARWVAEGKLYLGPEMAVAIQVDWWKKPRTMWVNPLRGSPAQLLPAIGRLAYDLGQEEWQAFLPSDPRRREEYARLGLRPHPTWGDHIHLYERLEGAIR